jgi:hypothetical protein
MCITGKTAFKIVYLLQFNREGKRGAPPTEQLQVSPLSPRHQPPVGDSPTIGRMHGVDSCGQREPCRRRLPSSWSSKLVNAAAKTWRRLKGENQLPKVVQGVKFQNGIEVIKMPVHHAA